MQENTRMTKLHYERRFECILEYSRDFTLDAIVPARLVWSQPDIWMLNSNEIYIFIILY